MLPSIGRVIGVDVGALPVVITDCGCSVAFHVSGDWEGVVVDRQYVELMSTFAQALCITDSTRPLQQAFIDCVQRELRAAGLISQAEAASNWVHHIQLDFWRTEAGSRVRQDCSPFLDYLEASRSPQLWGWHERALAYVVVHELGHWLFEKHGHEAAVYDSFRSVTNAVNSIQALPLPPEDSSTATGSPGQFGGPSSPNTAEEVFADRLVVGTLYLLGHELALPWTHAFVLSRCLQEAKRMIAQSTQLVELISSSSATDELGTDRVSGLKQRFGSQMHLRATLVSAGLGAYLSEILPPPETLSSDWADTVSAESGRLFRQSVIVFACVSGPNIESPLLRAISRRSTGSH